MTKELKAINPSKAYRPDQIPQRLLKECTSEIAPSLTRLINLSLRVGCVPKDWKCANYRPISLLSLVSKFAERCVFAHFYSFIVGNIIRRSMALLRDAQLSPSFWTLCIG